MGNTALSLFFLMAFIGGCAGSTACGLSLSLPVDPESRDPRDPPASSPQRHFRLRYNGRPVNEEVAESVLTFAITFSSFLFWWPAPLGFTA